MKRRNFIKGSAILGMAISNKETIAQDSGLISEKKERRLHRILDSHGVNVGTLPVMRAFAGNNLDYVSPYVLFDEFGPVHVKAGSDPLRVDAHPHAGVTPTTYFLSGTGHHKDSLQYDFQIGKGDFMMFNSGKGAIHMEESGQELYDKGGSYHGFQIWLNTPAKHKFDDPSTLVYREKNMGILQTDSYEIKIVLGELFGEKSNIELYSPAFYYHIKLYDNGRLSVPVHAEHNAFIYQIAGELEIEGKRKLKKNQVALYERGGETINVYSECASEFLLLGGQPLNEPVFSYGPFVMNNEAQIHQCIRNYNAGLMGNPALVNQ